MKKSRTDAFKSAINSYLECRNYPEFDLMNNTSNISQSAEQMAVTSMVQYDTSKTNSILFSCINNDPAQYDIQYNRLVNFIKEIKLESAKNELLGLLSPLLCHLYLEMLRGGHGTAAQVFFKHHSATLPQKDLSYHQPIDGNLPSALYRPNSLEQLFNSLQNGTIDNDAPEKDLMNQILDDISSIYTLQDVEAKPSIAAFRSCQYDLALSQDALNLLKSYLAKHGHVLLIQVLRTWFHIEINVETTNKDEDDEHSHPYEQNHIMDRMNALNEKHIDNNDIFAKCNGHAEYPVVDKELKDLQDAIKGVHESTAPLKLYKIAAPDTHLICAKTDTNCNMLCGGFSNSEIRLWDLGLNNMNRNVNRNVSEVELACNMIPDPDGFPNSSLQVGAGLALRGHSGPVQAVAVLGREQLLLSASHDASMRAWRLKDYSCASIYRGHNYPIWCMDVSKNGLFIVTGSHDKTAKLWSLDRTFPIRIFAGHSADVTCVKFHPNEAYVATGGADRTLRLWSVAEARLVRVLAGLRATPRALAFSPDGTKIASAGDDKKLRVWEVSSCACVWEHRTHAGRVLAADWAPRALASAASDAAVRLWPGTGSTSETALTYSTKCSYVVDVQVHPDWVVAIGTVR